ncbi:MAG: prolipoprotein diacylglyceryl transferase [Planctomycetota bacterium]|jgi:phosphatidylglycerol:prolipoprotein diacylglycerol transferase
MITLGAWLHTIDPFAIQIGEGIGIRWYGLAYLAGFVVGWWILRRNARSGRLSLVADRIIDHMFVLILGVLVGGRLGYVLFYDIALLTSFEGSVPYWGLLALNRGGMASHGGMVGVLVACWWIARREGVRMMHVLDAVALAAPAGLFFGRVANFINGELLGAIVARPGEDGPWWSVRYPQELVSAHGPELTLEQGMELGQLLYEAVPLAGESGQAPVAEIVQRYELIELVQRGVGDFGTRLEPLLASRHPSQLYQALAEGLVLGVVLWLVWRCRPRVGVVASCFGIFYGVMRVLTEVWRLPDDQYIAEGGSGVIAGLSRGQWLSVGMVVVGLVLLVWSVRRGVSHDEAKTAQKKTERSGETAPEDASGSV